MRTRPGSQRRSQLRSLATTAALGLAICGDAAMAADVDDKRIIGADKEPANWLSHGRTYSEQRFSPLTKINTANVGKLGLAWSVDIKTAQRAGWRRRRSWSTA